MKTQENMRVMDQVKNQSDYKRERLKYSALTHLVHKIVPEGR